MNDDEADEVLLLMSQLWWKSSRVPEGTLKLWHSSLMNLEKTAATQCINELVRDYPYWPAISEFRQVYDAMIRREKMEVKPIEREYLPREENIKRLRELRANLNSKG